MELWRYPGGVVQCMEAREAARGSTEWREAIANIAPLVTSFSTTALAPVPFSPWK